MKLLNETSKKKYLIYGIGKSGISSLKYLNKKNECYIFDDNHLKITKALKKFYLPKSSLLNYKFDNIIISPGINIKNCILSSYLKKNNSKIITDLDIFYQSQPKIPVITITGTNGKSTTCKLLNNILLDQQIDARLTGNIGNPILSEKNITKDTIFVVEASSYQLAYSKFYKSKFSVIINISPDHLDRHITMKNYINSKLKSVTKQTKNDISIIPNISLFKNALKKKKNKIKNNFFKRKKIFKFKK